MWESILGTLQIMGWLGIVLGILVLVNTITGALINVWSGKEEFSYKKLFKGLFKSLVFYLSAIVLSIACTMLPFINEMITNTFGVALLSGEMLNSLSSVGILGIVLTVIITHAKKAIKNTLELAKVCIGDNEEITWFVEDPNFEDVYLEYDEEEEKEEEE